MAEVAEAVEGAEAQVGVTEGEPQAAPASAEPFPDLTQRFDAFEQQLGQFGERIEGALPGQPLQEEPEGLAALLGGAQPGQQEQGIGLRDLLDDDPESVFEHFIEQGRNETREAMQQEMRPLLDRFREQDLAALEETYPDLADVEKAKPVITAARAHAEQFGKPDLVEDAGFIEMVYLASRAREQAGQESPAGGQPGVQLENGGATPAEPQLSTFEQLAQQPSNGPRAFWGMG